MTGTQQTTLQWSDPTETRDAVAREGLRGLSYLQAIVDGCVPTAPAIALAGLRLTAVAKGEATITFSPQRVHLNAMGLIHGGIVSTALDSTIGYAILATLDEGKTFSTLQLNVTFVRPVMPGQDYICHARVRHGGRSTVTAEANVSAGGKEYATATAIGVVRDAS